MKEKDPFSPLTTSSPKHPLEDYLILKMTPRCITHKKRTNQTTRGSANVCQVSQCLTAKCLLGSFARIPADCSPAGDPQPPHTAMLPGLPTKEAA